MKQELLKNGKDILVNSIDDSVNNINENSKNFNDDFTDQLKSTGDYLALYEQNLQKFKELNPILSKKDYHFPDFLNLGKLVNYTFTPSRILNNKSYITEVPLLIPIRDFGLAIFNNPKYKNRINSIIEVSALKLIGSLPNGLCKVSLIDKTGAGQNFPRLSTLHEKFIDGKVLSEDSEIELELEGLKNSMSTITQSISANGFESVEDYNKKTDEVPQQYQIVCVSNFPTGFNKKASENLLSLIESGSKAGIYVLMTFSVNPALGPNQNVNGLTLQDFTKYITLFEISDRPDDYVTKKMVTENLELYKIPLINEKDVKSLFNNTYKMKIEQEDEEFVLGVVEELNNKIENISLRPVVDLEKFIPEQLWTKNAGKGVSIPFGKRGIENVYLSLGVNQYGEDEGTHHGIIGGATGSGKTVLVHDLILQMAMNYSPRDLQFYLLDYKEGTEFAIYKDFPYVQILSMEGEVEFGLEVLDRAIKLMEERGALFKEVGVANLNGYNSKVDDSKKLPRIIIAIDEFQALLPKNQKISSLTNEKLDRILRLGRSFGINLLLLTQTLKGIDLDAQILSNMPLRVALTMDEKDAIKIFGEGNSAPKFLRNPGEGIYNKSYGNSKANIHFQAFRAIGDTVPNIIKMLNNYIEDNLEKEYKDAIYESRFVYSGENDALIENCTEYARRLEIEEQSKDIYIGESTGLSTDHVKFVFEKEFADNLLIVGHEFNKAASVFISSIKQISKFQKENDIYLFNYNSGLEDKFKDILQDSKYISCNNKNAEDGLNAIYDEFIRRKNGVNSQVLDINTLNHIYNFQFFIESSKLFDGGGFKNPNVDKLFQLIKEGPELGIHSIYYVSDFNTITNLDISRELSKFKKKMSLRGGNSLKIFGQDAGVEFSKSLLISIVNTGEVGAKTIKFKPYKIEGLENSND